MVPLPVTNADAGIFHLITNFLLLGYIKPFFWNSLQIFHQTPENNRGVRII